MPEIAEVARTVHFLRLHLVGKRISKVVAPDDPIVFGKAGGTTGPQIEAAAKGKQVLSAGCQGKYFWITFDKPPHLVMHFGMTGWLHINGEETAYKSYYNKLKKEEKGQWPPRFWKFQLETDSRPPVQLAFTDARRLGRVRVVDCPGPEIRKHTPLVENGPDPVIDTDIFTENFLRKKVKSRKVPIKALLLDQKFISGIGNWVGDEVLFHARLHPELYCDQLSDTQIKTLYESIRFICQMAVDKLGDPDELPADWIFHYRWGKGKNSAGKLPSGEKLAFVTVGGRTSCYAPALQKKTGAVAGEAEVKEEDSEVDPVKKGRKMVKREEGGDTPVPKSKGKPAGRSRTAIKEEEEEPKSSAAAKKTQKRKGASAVDDSKEAPSPLQKKQRKAPSPATAKVEAEVDISGRRRSGRLRNQPIN